METKTGCSKWRSATASALLALIATPALAQMSEPSATEIISQESARYDEGPWGRIWVYQESAENQTDSLFTAKIELEPGQEIHPPHSHAEEEYLLVISGSGTWSIDGEDFPASTGDLLYAAPLNEHGIISGSDGPMVIFVWKWRGSLAESRTQ